MASKGVTKQLFVWIQEYGGREFTGESYARGSQLLEERLAECLDQIAWAGYQGVEGWLNLWGKRKRAEEVARLLTERGLTCPSVYDGGVYHVREEAEKTIRDQLERAEVVRDALGVKMLTIDPSPKKGGDKTDEELAVEAESLDRLGEGLKGLGMSLGIHNHTPQARQNARELRAIAAGCDPELVSFALDIEWLHRAGVDPYTFLDQFASRVGLVHVRNAIDGVWAEVFGEGDIDYARVAALLDQSGFDGQVVVELAYEKETAITRSLAENMKLSREYAREIFGV